MNNIIHPYVIFIPSDSLHPHTNIERYFACNLAFHNFTIIHFKQTLKVKKIIIDLHHE